MSQLAGAQIAALKAELSADPKGLGYAQALSAGDMRALAGLLNATTGPGAETVGLSSVPTAAMLDAFAADLAKLQTDIDNQVAAALQFRPLLNLLMAPQLQTVDLTNAWLQQQFSALIAAGYATQAQVAAATTATASRAQVLFWQGIVLDAVADVAAAVNS